MNYLRKKIGRYLDELGSDAPIPGGGSAAALVASVGTGLAEMAARFSSKKTPASKLSAKRLNALRKALSKLVTQDAKIFKKLGPHFKEAKGSKNFQSALKKSAEVPLKICELSVRAMEIAVAEKIRVSRWLSSDLAEAGVLLDAAFRSARLNVETNLRDSEDAAHVSRVRSRLDRLERTSRSLEAELLSAFSA